MRKDVRNGARRKARKAIEAGIVSILGVLSRPLSRKVRSRDAAAVRRGQSIQAENRRPERTQGGKMLRRLHGTEPSLFVGGIGWISGISVSQPERTGEIFRGRWRRCILSSGRRSMQVQCCGHPSPPQGRGCFQKICFPAPLFRVGSKSVTVKEAFMEWARCATVMPGFGENLQRNVFFCERTGSYPEPVGQKAVVPERGTQNEGARQKSTRRGRERAFAVWKAARRAQLSAALWSRDIQ